VVGAAGPSARSRRGPSHPLAADGSSGRSAASSWHRRRCLGAAWDGATADGARAAGDGQPEAAAPWRQRCPQRSPRRCAGAPVRGHPTATGDGAAYPGARRPDAPRGAPPLGGKRPLAPRPGASARRSRRWARTRWAHVRTTVRCTPTTGATAEWAYPAASRRRIFPRRAHPAAMVVDRCQRSKVGRASGDMTTRQEDFRPRAIAISSPSQGMG